MKKFYISIFAAIFLLGTFTSQAQVYNSITSNPLGLTYDDPAFWQGGVTPPNPCTGCTININASGSMVQAGQSTANPDYTIFTNQIPVGPLLAYPGPLTVGTKFQATQNGVIKGARFYKDASAGGTHIAGLYSVTPTTALLASATYTNETASGWQTVEFSTPIPITNGNTYIIAYWSSDGKILVDDNYFATSPPGSHPAGVSNGPLTALPANAIFGDNGLYDAGAALAFPGTPTCCPYVEPNLWADVIYSAVNLDDMVFSNSTIKINGAATVFNINTYVELKSGSRLVMATDPSYHVTLNLNDQLDLSDAASYVQIGNINSYINTNNIAGNTIVGPHDDFTDPGNKVAGIYSILSSPVGGYNYSYVITPSAIGFNQLAPPPPTIQQASYAYQPLNCGGAGGCNPGFVSGPALSGADPLGLLGIIFSSSTPLPVQLVQFIATKKTDGTVLISWSTSQEQNSDYFDVERSGDQSSWTKIGTLQAKGFSSKSASYNLTDKLPLDGNGYYRLKMVDLDAKFKYSKVAAVSSGNDKQALVIYSNPFSDQIRLKVNVSRTQNLVYTVTDLSGKTCIQESHNASLGDNFVNLQPRIMGSGMYILSIHGDSYDQTIKIEKQ